MLPRLLILVLTLIFRLQLAEALGVYLGLVLLAVAMWAAKGLTKRVMRIIRKGGG